MPARTCSDAVALTRYDCRAARLWKNVQTALANCGVHAARAERIAAARDLDKQAQIVSGIF